MSKSISITIASNIVEGVDIFYGSYDWPGDYFPQIGDTIVVRDRDDASKERFFKIIERIIRLNNPDRAVLIVKSVPQ